jgi:hypothetical protein
MMATVSELLQRRHGIAANRHLLHLKRELLLGETARGVVVLERNLCAGDTQILRLDIQPRQGKRPLHLLLEIADRHGGQGCGRPRWRRWLALGLRFRQSRRCKQQEQHSQDGWRKAWPDTVYVASLGTSLGWRLPALSGPHRGKDLLTHQGLVPRMTCNSGCEFTRSLPRKTATDACACGKSCCQSAARIGPLTMRFIDKWQGGAQSF